MIQLFQMLRTSELSQVSRTTASFSDTVVAMSYSSVRKSGRLCR